MTGLVATAHDEQGAAPRLGLWRVSDRATFEALRRHGHRARRGPISVTWLAPDPTPDPTPPRVDFAVGKAAGGAVRRNRIRRRLRAGLRELQHQGRLPAGTYLLSARPEAAEIPLLRLSRSLPASTSSIAGWSRIGTPAASKASDSARMRAA